MTTSSPGVLSARNRPGGSPPSESHSAPGTRNVLAPEQLVVQLKNVLVPAPEKFAKFAKFAKFKPITRRGWGRHTVASRAAPQSVRLHPCVR
jgi:hypothetical protein